MVGSQQTSQRIRNGSSRPAYAFGPFVLDTAERRLSRESVALSLPPKAFDVLACLLEHAGHLLTKQQIFDLVWHGAIVSDNALMQAVRQIRTVLDDDASNPTYLETVPRSGYRFVADQVREISPEPPYASDGAADTGPGVPEFSPLCQPGQQAEGRALYLQGRVDDEELLRRYEALLRAFVATLQRGSRVTLAIVEDTSQL